MTPHSHSGYNAPRHHLLGYRQAREPRIFTSVTRDLVTARRVLDCVVTGEIDVGPLDAYWHHLLAMHRPDLVADIRVIERTALAPMPAFVAGPNAPAAAIARLKGAFAEAHRAAWFAELAPALAISGFALVAHDSFATTLQWEREALAAGYPAPE